MEQFIYELEYNQNININQGLENRVDLDYIINNLKYIQKTINDELSYFKYHNKNLTKKQDEKIQKIDDIINDINIPF